MISNKFRLNWAWISGWGIPPAELANAVRKQWPEDRHTVFAPTETAISKAKAINPDILAGYSLGSLLLLSESPSALPRKTMCVAPILAFDAEAGLGGKTATRTRIMLQTKFAQNPLAAVKLYLRLVGMSDLASQRLPYSESDLRWGLEALGKLHASIDSIALTHFYIGTQDTLTDVKEISRLSTRLEIIEGQDHDYRGLIPNISRNFQEN